MWEAIYPGWTEGVEFTTQQKQRLHWAITTQSSLIPLIEVQVRFLNSIDGSSVGGQLHYNENIVNSTATVPLYTGDNYVFGTNHITYSGRRHHDWNGNTEDYYLSRDQQIIRTQANTFSFPQTANFEDIDGTVSITCNNCQTDDLQIHDPWYVENPSAGVFNWIQPDDFQTFSIVAPSGTHQVFLNQNPNNLPDLPIYRLKAPSVGQVTQNDIFVFDNWTVSPSNGATLNTNSATTTVVFHDVGSPVTITANYVNALSGEGTQVIIAESDNVRIKGQGQYVIQYDGYSQFGFDVSGNLTIEGTEENPIVFTTSEEDDNWFGFYVNSENASLTLRNVIIENARYAWFDAIFVERGSLIMENCLVRSSNRAVYINENSNGFLNNNVFVNIGQEDADYSGITCTVSSLTGNNVTFNNNTIIDYEISFQPTSNVEALPPALTMINNIFYHKIENEEKGIQAIDNSFYSEGDYVFCDYNLIFGFDEIWSDEPAHNYIAHCLIDLNPDFVNPQNGDYHLAYESLAIDAGDPNSPNDPDGTIADMGALYYQLPNSELFIEGEVGDNPTFYWEHMVIPDYSHHEVWRYYTTFSEDATLVAQVTGGTWMDTDYVISQIDEEPDGRRKYKVEPIEEGEGYHQRVNYQTRSKDVNQHHSPLSNQVHTYRWIEGNPPHKMLAEPEIPDHYVLNNAYPNPFNPVTRIKFGLPEKSHIQLVVYDLLGREIVTLKSGIAVAGWHSIQWGGYNIHGTKVPSGIYIYTLTAESLESDKTFVETKKIVLLK